MPFGEYASCTAQADARWTDVWVHVRHAAADEASAHSGGIPGFVAFAELLDGVERGAGVMPDGAASPV